MTQMVVAIQVVTKDSTLAAALDYAERGWKVLPVHTFKDGNCSCKRDCPNPGKHPRISKWPVKATTDPQTIKEWWQRWPDANVGLLTGPESGFFALDLDTRSNGDKSLTALMREHGELPKTITQVTGGGGLHFLFTYPPYDIGNTAGKIAEGLDIRGERGFIVAAPSLHKSGRRYKWNTGADTIADAPDWLLQKLMPVNDTSQERIPDGTRNETLASIAGRLRQQGKNRKDIETALLEINALYCDPPKEMEIVCGIAASIERYEPGNGSQSTKTRWQNQIRDDQEFTAAQKAALFCLSLEADQDGRQCFPTQERIAEKACCDVKTARTALHLAQSKGLLATYRKPAQNKRGWSLGYILQLPLIGNDYRTNVIER